MNYEQACLSLSCHNRIHRLGGLNNRNLFLIVLLSRNSRSRCPQLWFPMRLLSLVCRKPLSCCVLMGLSLCFWLCVLVSSYKDTSQSGKLNPLPVTSILTYSLKIPSLNTDKYSSSTYWGTKAYDTIYEFWEDTIQSIRDGLKK